MLVRAAVHVHSDWSHDGSWPLSKLARTLGRAGYRVVLTTEHDELFDTGRWERYRQACREASSSRVLILPGIEYADPSNTVHVMVWGVRPFLGAQLDTGKLLARVNSLNGLAVLSHPSRRDAWRRFDRSWAPLLLGLELWNRKVDGVAPSREARSLWMQAPHLVPFVGLDFHRANQFFPLAMMLRVENGLSEQPVLQALRERRVAAEFLGLPLHHFTEGTCGKAMAAAERLRRAARKILKKTGR